MKKRKTYEISVIDKTYSKIISDETKFYTSDTSLELVFKLKETDYNFESAEIVLLNIDDRSLTTRPVSKVNNDFVYELDDDIIPHYGEWRGQLRFEAGETYVSSPVKFRIENDLSNERPPQLSDVQSWVSLKRYADSLTEELKQAVLSIEGVEDTFNTNELERQATFEANESERDETFNDNEATRQTAFDNNEDNRTETFNANEVTRQENETVRQQAETQRTTAESSRVSAEEQRKIDHANRSAELAGKANKKQEDWLYPTIINSVADVTMTPCFYKDEFGVVHLSGRVTDIVRTRLTLFTLPSNYRPNVPRSYPSVSGGGSFGFVTVTNSGAVTMTTGNTLYVSFDGITFKV